MRKIVEYPTESYYYAEVSGSGYLLRAYTARVVCQHPNGETLHFERKLPFYWLAKLVALRLAKSKAYAFKHYWRKEFVQAPPVQKGKK